MTFRYRKDWYSGYTILPLWFKDEFRNKHKPKYEIRTSLYTSRFPPMDDLRSALVVSCTPWHAGQEVDPQDPSSEEAQSQNYMQLAFVLLEQPDGIKIIKKYIYGLRGESGYYPDIIEISEDKLSQQRAFTEFKDFLDRAEEGNQKPHKPSIAKFQKWQYSN